MLRNSLRNGAATLALATLVAAGMTAAPFSLDDDFSLQTKTADAKNGNGGGNDKGGRGGNDKGGNDKGGKGGNSANAGASSSSLDATDEETEEPEVETAKKKGMGSLSASNSSQRARERASTNSRPGALGEYERALEAGDVEAAAEALARAANKEITPENVGMVNENLGIDSTPEMEADMATKAEAIRSGEVEADPEGEGEETTAEGEGDDTEEGLDEIANAADDLINGETADDWEVH